MPFALVAAPAITGLVALTAPALSLPGAVAAALLLEAMVVLAAVVLGKRLAAPATTALRLHERRQREISDLVSDMAVSWLVTPDGRFEREWSTDRLDRFLGVSPGASFDEQVRAVLHPDDQRELAKARGRLVAEPCTIQYDLRWRRASDGAWRWVRHTARSIHERGEDGPQVRILLSGEDVTGAREAALSREEQLAWEALSGAISRRFLAAPPNRLDAELAPALEGIRAFLGLDRVTLNEALPDSVRALAWARQEGIPEPLVEASAEEFPATAAALRGGTPFRFEALDALRESAPRDAAGYRRIGMEAALLLPMHAAGTFVGVLFLGSRPKRAWPEEERRRLAALAELLANAVARLVSDRALRQSERETRRLKEFYAAILENVREGILVTDPSDRIDYLNRAEARALGLSREHLLGRHIFDGTPHAADLELREQYERARDAAQPTPHEGRVVLPDGREVLRAGWFVPLVGEGGAYGGMVCTAEDVTDRRAVEETLRQTQAQFLQAQKMEAVGRLAGGVAHDFNNLLSVIMSYAEVLQGELPEGDPRRDDLAEIVNAARKGASLTRQLLAFSRKQVATPRVVRLGELVSGAQKLLERLIGEDVALAVTGANAPGRVRVDPGHLEQVLLNLAVNARDAMPEGGRLTIDVGAATLYAPTQDDGQRIGPGEWATLTVTDSGCGMDEATRAHVFEPFFSTKAPGKGTGLGLATVYGIVQQAGGHVAVHSAPGEGATFRIYLPLAERAPTSLGVLASTPDRAAPGRGGETVLVAEDDPALRVVMERLLRGAGYHVLAAESGEAALRVAEEHRAPIQLLLSDVVMPGMNGRELAARLSAAGRDFRTLYLSGYTDDILGKHGVLDPGTHLLHKPFTQPQLLEAVRRRLAAACGQEDPLGMAQAGPGALCCDAPCSSGKPRSSA